MDKPPTKDPTGGSTDKDAQAGSTVKERTFRCSTDKDAQAGSTVKERTFRCSTDKERRGEDAPGRALFFTYLRGNK